MNNNGNIINNSFPEGNGEYPYGDGQQPSSISNIQFANGNAVSEDDEPEEPGSGRKAGRRKIKIEYIQDKSRRHITFSKRKAGIMKKAYELSTLTGTQVLLLVVSETGLVYTFTTPKLQPLVTKAEGKNLIQSCLNSPDDPAKDDDQSPGNDSPGAKESTTTMITKDSDDGKRTLDSSKDNKNNKRVALEQSPKASASFPNDIKKETQYSSNPPQSYPYTQSGYPGPHQTSQGQTYPQGHYTNMPNPMHQSHPMSAQNSELYMGQNQQQPMHPMGQSQHPGQHPSYPGYNNPPSHYPQHPGPPQGAPYGAQHQVPFYPHGNNPQQHPNYPHPTGMPNAHNPSGAPPQPRQ